ncbi:DUF6350 family protein [Raineyella sp. LH-20]|uniref:cell division protein PerM n=1 Tax=Raineyella sp. LH-20 TaxID=3081204 RepID=UPI002953EEBB|nr:DUF6350 family protein [Raineyella sp. LH-20]WOP18756.1 DUF6350 family protein [Raineyella sp. LH-20]
MSQNRNTPPRTRPDLGRPAGVRRTPRDGRARTADQQPDDLVEGVTGVRPELPLAEVPLVTAARRPGWLWILAAGGVPAVVGWVALAALASLAWLTAPVGTYGGVLAVSTQLWLAGHGGGLYIEGTRWTLVPYGISLLLVWLLTLVSGEILRRWRDAEEPRGITLLTRGALVVLIYAVIVGGVGLALGNPRQGVGAFAGAVAVAVAGVGWAGARTFGRGSEAWVPDGVRRLLRALAIGLLTLATVGAGALVTGLVVHWAQVVVLTGALGGGVVGGLGAVVAQAAYLPTVIVWAVSYTLGAGVGLGDGSLVSPSDTHLGLLPGWPLTAAVPPNGPGTVLGLVWLAGGVVAGGLAAWTFLRGARRTRPDTSTASGGGVGLLVGLVTTGIGLLTRGDLGVSRLVGLGPRPLELLVLAVTLATAGGLVTGLGIGIARWLTGRRQARVTASVPPAGGTAADVPTGTSHDAPIGTASTGASDTPAGSVVGADASDLGDAAE